MNVHDVVNAFQIVPSTASPGKSIIMKKENEPESSPSLLVVPKSEKKTASKKDMLTYLTVEQNHIEAAKIEKFKQEASMNSILELATPNLEEQEAKTLKKRQKTGRGKIRPVSGNRKLQVCLIIYRFIRVFMLN